MRVRCLIGIFLCVAGAWTSVARAQNDLKKNLKDTDVAAHWVYNDIAAGFAEARATGKPLLVTLRCVP